MTVAAAPTVPGTPNSTAGIKSDVVVTAATPSNSANEVGASRLYVNGISTARATTPPKPGMQPIASPIRTPRTRMSSRCHSSSNWSAWSAIANWPSIGGSAPPASRPVCRRGLKSRRVLHLIEPVEAHRLDDAVADDDQPRLAFAGVEVLVNREGRDVDEIAPLPFGFLGFGFPFPMIGVDAIELHVP